MKKKAWLTLLMAAVLLATSSCGDKSGDIRPKDPASTDTELTDTEPGETETDYYQIIGEYDFDGRTFAIVYSAAQLGPM